MMSPHSSPGFLMKNRLFQKLLGMAVLVLILLIPLWMIEGTIDERQHRHSDVLEDITASTSGPQIITGPVLALPWTRIEPVTRKKKNKVIVRHFTTRGVLYFLPADLDVSGQLTTEDRHRGIFTASVYHAALRLAGSFSLPANGGITESIEQYTFGSPFLAMGVSDIRGIHAGFRMAVNGDSLRAEPGTNIKFIGDGLRAAAPAWNVQRGDTLTYAIDISVMGTTSLSLRPLGEQTRMSLSSSWPHPGFSGKFLPTKREIGKHGFTAEWSTSVFATNLREHFSHCSDFGDCEEFKAKLMTVNLLDPVDHYSKTHRAMKYDLMFIGLAFAICFMLEILKSARLHVVHYGLVGMGLAVFYLLLLSLSEHLGFGIAYVISTLACCCLVSHYLSGVLENRRQGWGFGAALSLLFSALYGLLSSEDHALLMGTILVFSVLAGFMLMTRRIDWFRLAEKPVSE
jgi:inner membrane protein